MSVEIERRVDDESNVEYFYIDGELPSEEQLTGITQIGTLTVKNIQNAKNLQELLSKLPIDKINRVEIMSCDFEGVDLQFFGKFQAMTEIALRKNSGIDYDEVLELLPNKEQIKGVNLQTDKEERRKIDINRLKEFSGLSFLSLANFHDTDMEALHSYLQGAQALEQFVFAGKIESLDFISGVDLDFITIIDKELDLGLVTPEVAKQHKYIRWATACGEITTEAIDDGQTYELRMALEHIDEFRTIIDAAARVKIFSEVQIENKNKLKSLIENKNILKDTPFISILVPHMGVITPQELKELESQTHIRRIRVMDSECNKGFEKNYEYKTEQYEVLYEKIQEIVGDISEELTDIQKFMIIYRRLGLAISYDHKLTREEKRKEEDAEYLSEYVNENQITGRNLINGLIKGQCVCSGYSDILYNCLQAVGINACKVTGELHAWNKVQIDGVWYNVDLTWDGDNILRFGTIELKHCLRSDKEFEKNHKQEDGRKIECGKDYPREEIEKASKFAEEFMRQQLDAEYETIAEEPNFFDKLKARAMTLFGKRKMIEAAQSQPDIPATQERREKWLREAGIEVANGEEISKVDPTQSIGTRNIKMDREK